MKKFLLVALFALLATATTQAQDLFSIGPRVGVNFNSPSDATSGLSNSTGWNIGLSVEVRPIKLVGITIDAMYSKSTFSVADIATDLITGDDKGSIGYFDLPILANIYVFKGLHVKAGVQPSFKLGEGGIFDQVSEDIKGGAFAIPVGVGYTMGNGLNIDVRYNLSTTKLVKDTDFRNRQFVIGVGWRF